MHSKELIKIKTLGELKALGYRPRSIKEELRQNLIKKILKKTSWYEMSCLDDSNMKPQLKEFIDEVRWMDKKEVKKALKNSYRSIEEVFNKYSKDYSL